MEKFNKRWSVTSVDSYEESFKKFKIRILNIFKEIDDHVKRESITVFCQYYGIVEQWRSAPLGGSSWSTNIKDRLNEENDEKEFYRLIELIFALDILTSIGYDHRDTYSRNILFHKVTEAIGLSEVNVSIAASDGEIILYPRGEKMLDEELVESPLSFLDPKSSEHFVQALQFYQLKQHVKSSDSLRRSLEEFLRIKLGNSRGLNTNIKEMQKRLKSDGRDAQVRNIIGATFTYFDKYFDENCKHNDGNIDDSENEFLIYQSGVLMRYINKNL